MKMVDIQDMTTVEIETKVVELKKELLNLRFQLATGNLENTAEMKRIKKDVARLNTKLNQEVKIIK